MNDTAHDKPIIPTPKERRRRNREEMKAAILQAARELMSEEGVGSLNLQQLARRVGMRAPSLYNYFPNKMAIYEALFAQGMRQFRQEIEAILEAQNPTENAQEAIIRHYMTFALENPELFQLLFERPIPDFVPSEEGLQEGRKILETGTQVSEQQRAAGQIDPSIPTEHARDLFIALAHGLTALHLANEPHLPIGEGRFGSLIPMAVKALSLVYEQGMTDDEQDNSS